ncbi:hypothetical protein H6F50_09610 [Coleofasciculus sp. FACHB-712]|uniref:hypothetical protein n=1 Tax=Coleofasciculus sp. FACHB-712 TaxID=2692789 RepID=UPI0016872B0D|nr:hypothetical protein [Coleofasciculus sp. FACHB-712]MBD1942608.1 hypothetical protein [Coleofasciculus sp. FACHB-712]
MPESLDTCPPEFFRLGMYSWTLQTYLRLKADGFPCELTGSCPTEGIIFAGRSAFPETMQPGTRQLMVVHQGDKTRHPYAQLHIVQNLQDEILVRALPLWESYYMRHWPQPGLIPRNPARGDRFENIAYFGREENLAPELRESSWQDQLNSLGLRWHIRSNPNSWQDYSEVDAILAVRKFARQTDYDWKPATKLYQAWHAGVPAILGQESAYRSERKSQLDYLEVTTPEEAILALKRLQKDRELRRAMIENGRVCAQETQPEKLVAQWRTFLADVAVPAYDRWCTSSNLTRKIFLMRRDLAIKTKGMRKGLQRARNSVGIRTRIRSALAKARGV